MSTIAIEMRFLDRIEDVLPLPLSLALGQAVDRECVKPTGRRALSGDPGAQMRRKQHQEDKERGVVEWLSRIIDLLLLLFELLSLIDLEFTFVTECGLLGRRMDESLSEGPLGCRRCSVLRVQFRS
jgi:hypothetical protein